MVEVDAMSFIRFALLLNLGLAIYYAYVVGTIHAFSGDFWQAVKYGVISSVFFLFYSVLKSRVDMLNGKK